MKSKKDKQSVYRVQALERALDILDCFTLQNRDRSLSEVVEVTGLNKTTAKRLLANLTARSYLRQNLESKRYQLGIRLFQLGGIVLSSFSLRKVAASYMNRVQSETGATILLGVNLEHQLVYIDKREGRGMIRVSSDIGWRRPLHYGMLGMVLMADLDPKTVRSVLSKDPLEPHTPHSITDADAFSLRLEKIRKEGFLLDREEAVEGLAGIAAPIRDYSRRVVAALGISLPLSQVSVKKDEKRLIDLVKETTDAISSDLGYLKI